MSFTPRVASPTLSSRPSTDDVDSGHLIHQLQLEAELRAIQAQTFGALAVAVEGKDEEIARLRAELFSLTEGGEYRVVEAERYAMLIDAEYHLRRVLDLVNRSPLRWIAQRRPGFREMCERWPSP